MTPPFFFFLLSDLQKVLHDESSNSPEEGWSLASRSQFTEVWRKHCPNETVQLIKVRRVRFFPEAGHRSRAVGYVACIKSRKPVRSSVYIY